MMKLIKTMLGIIFLVDSIFCNPSCHQPASQDETVMSKPQPLTGNGIYVVPNLKSLQEVDHFMVQCEKMLINKIFIQTKTTKGEVYYPSKKFRTAKQVGGFDCYGAICDAARSRHITIHAWFVLFNEGSEYPVPIIKEHPEYLIVNRQGISNMEQPTWSTVDTPYSTYWVCLTAKGYRDYLKGIMQEVIDLYHPDGIHLDYIRYPEEVDGVILIHYGLMMNTDYLSQEERDKNADSERWTRFH